MKNCFFPTWQSAVCVHQWPAKERCLFSFQMSTQELGATKQIIRDHPKFPPAKQWSTSPLSICNFSQHKQDPMGSMHPKPQREDNPCTYCLFRPAQLSKEDSGLEVWNVNVCRGWMVNALLRLDVVFIGMEREYKKLPHAPRDTSAVFLKEGTKWKQKNWPYISQLYVHKTLITMQQQMVLLFP